MRRYIVNLQGAEAYCVATRTACLYTQRVQIDVYNDGLDAQLTLYKHLSVWFNIKINRTYCTWIGLTVFSNREILLMPLHTKEKNKIKMHFCNISIE